MLAPIMHAILHGSRIPGGIGCADRNPESFTGLQTSLRSRPSFSPRTGGREKCSVSRRGRNTAVHGMVMRSCPQRLARRRQAGRANNWECAMRRVGRCHLPAEVTVRPEERRPALLAGVKPELLAQI